MTCGGEPHDCVGSPAVTVATAVGKLGTAGAALMGATMLRCAARTYLMIYILIHVQYAVSPTGHPSSASMPLRQHPPSISRVNCPRVGLNTRCLVRCTQRTVHRATATVLRGAAWRRCLSDHTEDQDQPWTWCRSGTCTVWVWSPPGRCVWNRGVRVLPNWEERAASRVP